MEIWADGIRHSILHVDPLNKAVLRIGVNGMNIFSACWDNVFTVAAHHGEPVKAGNAAAAEAVGSSAPSVVVLQAAAKHVRCVVVFRNHVELLNGKVVQIAPGFAGVSADVNSAVIA